jgi:hypothetical protein
MANLGGAVFVSFNCLHYKGVNMKTTIDMAREVKATAYTNRHYPDRTTYTFGPEQLKAFEALVRADEREETNRRANASWTLMCEKMVASEREACAKVCEGLPMQQEVDVRDQCAAAIRARGST